ncbi:hypothetical protein AAFN47_19560 [Hoeflea sp. CAU 1731]
MTRQQAKPRSFWPTLLVAFLFYLPAALLWIGRPVAGVVASIIQCLVYIAIIRYLMWLISSDMALEQIVYWYGPVMFGGFVYFLFSIEIPLRLRLRSLPQTRLSELPYVIGIGVVPSYLVAMILVYFQ